MKSKMSTKGGAMGGKKKMPPGYKGGGKLEMVEKDGKMVPFFAPKLYLASISRSATWR